MLRTPQSLALGEITKVLNSNEVATAETSGGFCLAVIFDILVSIIAMKIIVKARPGARHNKIEKVDERNFIIHVTESPVNGKANAALVKLLAKYFDISPSLIEIISGFFARTKIFEIHI